MASDKIVTVVIFLIKILGDKDAGQWSLGSNVLRRPEETLPHQRKTEEESLDQPV